MWRPSGYDSEPNFGLGITPSCVTGFNVRLTGSDITGLTPQAGEA